MCCMRVTGRPKFQIYFSLQQCVFYTTSLQKMPFVIPTAVVKQSAKVHSPLVEFWIFLHNFLIFINMGPYGSENFKTLGTPSFKVFATKHLLQLTPAGGPHKMFFLKCCIWSLAKVIKNYIVLSGYSKISITLKLAHRREKWTKMWVSICYTCVSFRLVVLQYLTSPLSCLIAILHWRIKSLGKYSGEILF